MKRACSVNTNIDEYLTCEFHPAIKKTNYIRMKIILSIIWTIFFAQILPAQQVSNICDFGAKGDGQSMNTKAISQAIKACSDKGGGAVSFPSGTYLSGSFEILSNVTLNLEAGCKILASPNLKDYDELGLKTENRSTSFIWAKNAKNITITGRGIIDGNDMAFFNPDSLGPEWFVDYDLVRQGKEFKVRFPDGPLGEKNRPGMLMAFIGCENLLFEGITVQNAPNWNIHLACCKYVDFTNIKVLNSLLVPNADGMDISQSQHVHVSGCTLIAGDDGIAISPCSDGFCDGEASDISVTNCTIESRSAAIRIGWAKTSIRNCVFQNLVLTSNRGICINAREGEIIENILFSDIIINTRLHTGWWGKAEPIHISQMPLDNSYETSGINYKNALIRNIRFSDIMINSEAGILLYSYYPNAIQDISFDGITMRIKNGKYTEFSGGNFDLRPSNDRKLGIFSHDIPAFYFKGTKNIAIHNFSVIWPEKMPDYYTNAIFGEDFDGFRISQSALSVPPGKDLPFVHLKNGSNVNVDENLKSVKKENIR